MPVLAFDMSAENQASRRYEFRGKNNANYYEGELTPLSPNDVSLRIEKSQAGDFGIYKLTSRSPLAFRRSWTHIRSDRTNVTVFWFVRHGRITVSGSGGRYDIGPDQCAITRSSLPFYMELTADAGGTIEAMHVVVPTHRLQALISDNLEVGRPFPTSTGDLLLAERVFTLLFEEDDQIDADIAEQLIGTLLQGVGRTISRISGLPTSRCSITDKRVADITRYISQHFGNPDLNAMKVASSCGISLRYLCHILKKSDLSFSTMLWDARMNTAHAWLTDGKMQHYSLCEIAYMVGFKSSAHFSRMFKARWGMAPRDFRSTHMTAVAA